EVAGAEVRARRTALEAVGEEAAHLLERKPRGRPVGLGVGLGDELIQDALQRGTLPRVRGAGGGQRVGGVADCAGPFRDWLWCAERVDRVVQARDELGDTAGEFDRAAVDVV